MKANYSFEIPYQEVDKNRRLRLYSLENYLLNVAGRAADDSGYGIKALLPYGYTWIITRVNIEIDYIPTHTDKIRVETWIEKNAHMLSNRNYRIYLENGESRQIGRATSVWAVLDLKKREIVNAFSMPMFTNTEDGETLDLPRAGRLMPIQEPTGIQKRQIVYSDIDYNGHCNSCKYLEIALDSCMPTFLSEYLSQAAPCSLRIDINYHKEIGEGGQLDVIYKEDFGAIQYQLKEQNASTCCSIKISQIKKY